MNEPMEEQAVQRDVSVAFEYSYLHEDWVTPLADALAGTTAQEAVWQPDSDTKSIWQIVLHMAVWTENIVERAAQRERGESPGRPTEGAWPALPETRDDAAWEAAQTRLWNALDALRAHLAATPISAMLDCGTVGYSQFADLLCRFTHKAYHIGQITKLREWHISKNTSSNAEVDQWRQVAFSREQVEEFLSHIALPHYEADKILPFGSVPFRCFCNGFYFFARSIHNELHPPQFAEKLLDLAVRVEAMRQFPSAELWNQYAEQARVLLAQYFEE